MRLFVASLVVCLVTGCNGDIYVRDGVTDGDTFYISPYAAGNPDPVVQSWIRYSLARSVCQLQVDTDNPARANSFECERKARGLLLDAWDEETLADGGLRDSYLDDLRFVRNSGFLDEYVAHHLSKNGWALPNDLDMQAFHQWRHRELTGHDPETRIIGTWGYRNAAAAY